MASLRVIDVIDRASFDLLPPCADPGLMHASCDYWEDADRGSRAARAAWLKDERPQPASSPTRRRDPFAVDGPSDGDAWNPFAAGGTTTPNPFAPDRPAAADPFAAPGDRSTASVRPFDPFGPPDEPAIDNPFAPRPTAGPAPLREGPRKLQLLTRGLAVFGSYAKVLLEGDQAVAYAQFGPLSAYPRALRTRELYGQLPESPLPAVITCIATVAGSRGRGHARHLVDAVCEDLAGRGFAAVETYPTVGAAPDATSAATPGFWEACGFHVAAADDRYPVMRRELT